MVEEDGNILNMVNNIEGIPFFLILMILLSGFVIFYLYLFIDKYVVIIAKKRGAIHYNKNLLRKLKLFTWLVWFVISIYYLLLYSPVITLVFLIGFYLFTKEYWVNIYSGVLFLLSGKIRQGDYILFPKSGIEGVVNDFLLTELELKTNDGELIYFPFNKVLNNIIVIKEKGSIYYLNEFEVFDSDYKGHISKNEIRGILLNCPWTIVSKNIEINRLKNGYRIKVVSFNKELALYQKNYLIEKLKNLKSNK